MILKVMKESPTK